MSAAQDRGAAGGRWGWGALALVVVAFNMRIAVGSVPPVLNRLGLDRGQQSLLVTVPVLCFGLAAWAAPELRRRWGADHLITGALVALVLGLVWRALGPAWALFPGTVLAGLAVALLNVLIPALVRGRYADRAAPVTAAYTIAMSIGASLGAGLTVPLLQSTGSLALALGIWAAPAIVGVAVWAIQRQSDRPPPPADAGFAVQQGVPLRRLGRDRTAWLVTAFFGLQSLVFYAMLSWLPAIYQAKGASPALAGGVLAVLNTVGIGGNIMGPALAQRSRDQRLAVAAGIALIAAGLLGILLGGAGEAFLWAAVLGLGTGSSFAVALLLVVLRSPDAHTAVSLSASAQGLGYVIAASGPLVLGLIRQASGGWSVPLLVVLGLVGLELLAGLGAARDRL
ncbi:MAG: MFS transporter, partial [Candidatus Dormibacteria bacterium]